MPMIAGDVSCSAGLSKEIWDAMSAAGFPGEQLPNEDPASYAIRSEKIKKLCFALASSIVLHIQTNATVTGSATGVVPGAGVAPTVGTIT